MEDGIVQPTPSDDKSCTPQPFPDGLPTREWLPEQLIAFVQAQHRVILNAERALAVEYWRLGMALQALRSSFTHGQWEQFLASLRIETTKACRSRAIARTFSKEEDLAGLTVQQAYAARMPKRCLQAPADAHSSLKASGAFVKCLHHVQKLAEPLIDQAGFAEAAEAAMLLPDVERVLSTFSEIRRLLLDRISGE